MRVRYLLGQLLLLSIVFGQQSQEMQSPTGVLQGIITVSSGERLPGASLTLTPASPGQTPRSAVTGDQGEYKFTSLAEGSYSLRVEVAGFSRACPGIVLPGFRIPSTGSRELTAAGFWNGARP